MKLIILLLFTLTACSFGEEITSVSVTSQLNGFTEQTISTSSFLLTSYERVTVKGNVVNVYIEGDGRAWLSKRMPSLDPTPKNPVALELAKLDDTEDVIYLARPCQYTKMINGSVCDQKYWTSHRFASEVIEAMDVALNDIKQRHQITKFNLIGFSGGGNVAALLAAKRDDVKSLRTVAGNLNHTLQSEIHNVSSMPSSLNAVTISSEISHIPQLHFIGVKDKIVPQQIYDSYARAAGHTECLKSYVIKKVGHSNGWEAVWPNLLEINLPSC